MVQYSIIVRFAFDEVLSLVNFYPAPWKGHVQTITFSGYLRTGHQ